MRSGHCFQPGKLQLGLSYVGRYRMNKWEEPFHLGAQSPFSSSSKPHWRPGPQVTEEQTMSQNVRAGHTVSNIHCNSHQLVAKPFRKLRRRNEGKVHACGFFQALFGEVGIYP